MTWLGILAAVVLAVSCVVGYYRGFVKEIVSLLFFVISIAIVWTINPYMNQFLKQHTAIYETIQEQCRDTVEEQLKAEDGIGTEIQEAFIETLPLPKALRKDLAKNNNEQMYKYLKVDTFGDYIGDFLATMIVNGISFLATYLLVTIVLRVLVHLLYAIAELPGISAVNHLAGTVAGGLRGILLIWIVLLILTILYNTPVGKQGMALVKEDYLLSFFYSTNWFVRAFLMFSV